MKLDKPNHCTLDCTLGCSRPPTDDLDRLTECESLYVRRFIDGNNLNGASFEGVPRNVNVAQVRPLFFSDCFKVERAVSG